MKRVLFLVLVMGLLAGQAPAAPYELDATTALQFTNVGLGTGDYGSLSTGIPTVDPVVYGDLDMMGAVGFKGELGEGNIEDGDSIGTMTISAGDDAGLSGAAEGFQAFVANDNDDPWTVRLFVTTTSGGTFYSDDAPLAANSTAWLLVDQALDFDGDVTNIGFEIESDFAFEPPSNSDIFHLSFVPVPGAALLGFLGLAAAGLKLRKHV